MIQLDFVLYRFVCDIAAFTGLFAEDEEGRCIPDTAAFHCTWSRTPRSKQVASAVSDRVGGSTDSIYFKALGSDMALTFTTQTHALHIDGDKEVVTFALRPSQYTGDGPPPVIAKGTLDPAPYFDKPKKNYAIKLRDASGQVTGKLLFSLVVHEVETNGEERTSAHNSVRGRSPRSPATNSLDGSRASLSRNPARDRIFKPSVAGPPSVRFGTPPRAPASSVQSRQSSADPNRQSPPPLGSTHAGTSPHRSSPAPPARHVAAPVPVSSAVAPSPPVPSAQTSFSRVQVSSVDVQLERITVRSEGIDLDHPAPLLLGGDYNLKIRYGSFSYSTTRCVCCNPKELEYRGQQTCITLLPPTSTEKLRFSLWEDKKQVAGFSLDPAKFTAEPGVWKEYAIPFRYHPTGQKAALDVRVRRLVILQDGSPVGRHATTPPSHRQPTQTTGATEPIAFTTESGAPRRLTYQPEDASAWTAPAPAPAAATTVRAPPKHASALESTTAGTSTPLRRGASPPAVAPPDSFRPSPERGTTSGASPLARQGGSSPPGSIIVTRGFLHGGNSHRDATPHRFYDAASHHHNNNSTSNGGAAYTDRSAHTGARSLDGSVVRAGWERTPMQQRPPPLTQNLADLPADRRPPDDHETYISEVLARLNRQSRGGPRQQTSLVEEWMGWRDERERSRCNSVAHSHVRSNSVSSVVSRADSLASVTSRHASVPRATNSNADHSIMRPFTPDNTGFRRRRTSPSPSARNPLI